MPLLLQLQQQSLSPKTQPICHCKPKKVIDGNLTMPTKKKEMKDKGNYEINHAPHKHKP